MPTGFIVLNRLFDFMLEDLQKQCFAGAINHRKASLNSIDRHCPVGRFFEWLKEGKNTRQPYLVYFQQPKGVSMAVREWDGVEDVHQLMDHGRWKGPRPLTMAGLFDVSTYQVSRGDWSH